MFLSNANNETQVGQLNMFYTVCNICFTGGADKSLARTDRKNDWKVDIFRPTRRSLLPRRPGWTDSLLNFFFHWLAKVRVWSLLLVSFLVGLRTYQHPGNVITHQLASSNTVFLLSATGSTQNARLLAWCVCSISHSTRVKCSSVCLHVLLP